MKTVLLSVDCFCVVRLSFTCLMQLFHSGVSCDSCMKSGFTGRRYKCLRCCDYDLCSACYEAGLATSRHKVDHAMQCLLTRSDLGKVTLDLSLIVQQAIHYLFCAYVISQC